MKHILDSREKLVAAGDKSALAEFAQHLCDTVKKFMVMPVAFNPRYIPHKKIAAANDLAKRVEAKLKADKMVAPSELRGLYKRVVNHCG